MSVQNLFQSFNRNQKARGPWKQIRRNGFDYFQKHGLPTKKDEAWHYTSLKNLPEDLLTPQDLKTARLPKNLISNLEAYLNPQFVNLVFWNGVLQDEISDLRALQKIKIVKLDEIDQTTVLASIRQSRQKVGLLRQDSMEALNSAFAESGLGIEVPPNHSLGKPLQILFYQTSGKANYPKILVKVGRGSKLNLIETYVGEEQKTLTNAVTEMTVESSARLEYTRLQNEGEQTTHVGCTRIFLEKDSSLEALSDATGAALSRHNLDIHCLGENAHAQVHGLTLAMGSQHHDHHTLIDHVVGNCMTTQLYKSILDGQSRAIFNGRVQIRENAQKASSEQLNHNLLLSSQAEADSKPELGIYADDVKATHGSTIGQLNEDELFYFLSRAIPREKAVEMLSLGFAKDIIDRVSDEKVRDWLAGHLIQSYRKMKGLEA